MEQRRPIFVFVVMTGWPAFWLITGQSKEIQNFISNDSISHVPNTGCQEQPFFKNDAPPINLYILQSRGAKDRFVSKQTHFLQPI